MIAVVVSAANGCEYCQQHHGVALNNYWKNEVRVQSLRRSYQSAGLNPADVLLFQYATELTIHPDDFENGNWAERLRQAGLEDRTILDATLVIAYFNFVNRIVLALGVELEKKQAKVINIKTR